MVLPRTHAGFCPWITALVIASIDTGMDDHPQDPSSTPLSWHRYWIQVSLKQLFCGGSSRQTTLVQRLLFAGIPPFKPSRCIKASFYIPENRLNFPATKGFMLKISLKLLYQYMTIFFKFSPTPSHLYPLQVENCGSNSRLVVDEMTMVNSGLKGLSIIDIDPVLG